MTPAGGKMDVGIVGFSSADTCRERGNRQSRRGIPVVPREGTTCFVRRTSPARRVLVRCRAPVVPTEMPARSAEVCCTLVPRPESPTRQTGVRADLCREG